MMIPIRFRLVLMSFLAVFICYIDRVNISVAIIPMQEQFGWSEAQVGIIFSIFYIKGVISVSLDQFELGDSAVMRILAQRQITGASALARTSACMSQTCG